MRGQANRTRDARLITCSVCLSLVHALDYRMPAPVKKKRAPKKRVKDDVSDDTHVHHPKPKSGPDAELALERTISRIFLHRFEHDIARLFSTVRTT